MMAKKNDEIRQNLIPLSKQYMTLADAQADIANIPREHHLLRSPDVARWLMSHQQRRYAAAYRAKMPSQEMMGLAGLLNAIRMSMFPSVAR
jgi:hypothetical protein